MEKKYDYIIDNSEDENDDLTNPSEEDEEESEVEDDRETEEDFDRGEVEINYTQADINRMENTIKDWEAQLEESDIESYKEELELKIETLRNEILGNNN